MKPQNEQYRCGWYEASRDTNICQVEIHGRRINLKSYEIRSCNDCDGFDEICPSYFTESQIDSYFRSKDISQKSHNAKHLNSLMSRNNE